MASNFVFRFFEKLETHYGEGNVFLDIDRLPLGVDFRQVLVSVIGQVDIVFVVIGPHWNQRLRELRKDPKDFVRMEIEMAMAKPGMRVVPILLPGAEMPREQDLPPSLKKFPNLQGTRINQHYFHEEMGRMFKSLEMDYFLPETPLAGPNFTPDSDAKPLTPELITLLTEPGRPVSRIRRFVLPAVILLSVLGGAMAVINRPEKIPDKPTKDQTAATDPDKQRTGVEETRSTVIEDYVPPLVPPRPPPVPERIKSIPLPRNQKLEFVKIDRGNVRITIGNQSREVELSTFWISRTPVTNAQWHSVMAGISQDPPDAPKTGISFSEIISERFLDKLGEVAGKDWDVSLPTEAQWVGAATAATAGGPEYGTYLASFLGGGKEWCQDRYQSSIIGISKKNPAGPKDGNMRVVRGGSGSSLLTDRTPCQPASKDEARGFRVVLNAHQPD